MVKGIENLKPKGEIMKQAENGNTAKVHYTGKLTDGTVFDSSRDREPLEFTLGGGQIIPGFDEAVSGMAVGESKTVTIPSEKAYGPHREEMVFQVDRSQFPEGLNPEPGQQLKTETGEGHPLLVTVTEVAEDKVTLDANHPLSGKELTFEIELMEVA